MTSAPLSVGIYGIYLLSNGVALAASPSFSLGLLELSASEEHWVRILGLVCAEVGFYFLYAARKRMVDFFLATVYGRLLMSAALLSLVALQLAPAQLMLAAAIDAVSAIWTRHAIKQENKAP